MSTSDDGNLQIDPGGRTVVLDWGLACRTGEKAGWAGHVVGTPHYMAPEQLSGETVTPSTDVYSLGLVLFELLTGMHPLGTGGDASEILERSAHIKPPRPSLLRKDVPRGLDGIVLRSLEKDPRARFKNAGELLEELEGVS